MDKDRTTEKMERKNGEELYRRGTTISCATDHQSYHTEHCPDCPNGNGSRYSHRMTNVPKLTLRT